MFSFISEFNDQIKNSTDKDLKISYFLNLI